MKFLDALFSTMFILVEPLGMYVTVWYPGSKTLDTFSTTMRLLVTRSYKKTKGLYQKVPLA